MFGPEATPPGVLGDVGEWVATARWEEVGSLRRRRWRLLLLRQGGLFSHLLRSQDRGHGIMLLAFEEFSEGRPPFLVDSVQVLGLLEGLTTFAEVHLETVKLLGSPEAKLALTGLISSL